MHHWALLSTPFKTEEEAGCTLERFFFFSQNLIINCIKKTWTITKSFCILCGHFLNTYPLDSNLSFGQPRPEILHIAFGVF